MSETCHTVGGKIVKAPILAEHKGKKFVIALSGPLTNDHPADSLIGELCDSGSEYKVIVRNELVVRGNLPDVTRKVYQKLGG